MPSPGRKTTSNGYAADLARIEEALREVERDAFAAPVQGERVARYLYGLYQRCNLTGDLRGLRRVAEQLERAIACVGPAEDLCLLLANLHFKLHRLHDAKDALGLAPALAARVQGQVLLADIAFQKGQYAEAHAALEQLSTQDPAWDVWARLAHIEGKFGSTEIADDLYLKAADELTAKEMRSFAWVELQRGLLHLSRGRMDEALDHYGIAARAYPGYWLIDEHRADALAAQGDDDTAIEIYESVLQTVDKPELAQKLGEKYAERGDAKLAQTLFNRALAAYRESADRGEVHYWHHLTEYYADAQLDGESAVEWARRDLTLRDNFNTQTAMAWALHRAGRSVGAVAFIERALASGVKDASIYSKAAQILEAAGDKARGHQFEHKAAALNPLHIHVHTH